MESSKVRLYVNKVGMSVPHGNTGGGAFEISDGKVTRRTSGGELSDWWTEIHNTDSVCIQMKGHHIHSVSFNGNAKQMLGLKAGEKLIPWAIRTYGNVLKELASWTEEAQEKYNPQ